jgi:hypothetical protein
MPNFSASHIRPIEDVFLIEPRPAGPVVGFLAGNPIAEAVVDYFGHRYVYAGVAPRRHNGRYDPDALGRGEWIVEPGLVYREGTRRPLGRSG